MKPRRKRRGGSAGVMRVPSKMHRVGGTDEQAPRRRRRGRGAKEEEALRRRSQGDPSEII